MVSSPHLFELYLTPLDEARFRAIVTDSTLGSDAESELHLPFWDGDQDWRTTVIKVLESSRGFKADHFPQSGEQDWMVKADILSARHPSFAPEYLEKIGQALFQALLPTHERVGQIFQSALRKAEDAGVTLHLRLKFAADSAKRSRLADYPWELIHDGTRFLLHRRVQLSRYIAYDAVPPQQPLGDRLRVLLVSPRASDIGPLSDAEPEAIRAGITKAEAVSVEPLPTPTWRGLSAYLTETANTPQVIHFDGHGIFGKRCKACERLHASTKVETCQSCGAPLPEAQGFLAFEDEQGKAEFVSARSLAALVADQGIVMAVLSACQSGMAVTGESVFNGMAQQLIDAQVPAVVAMQYSVRVKEARDFAEQFYRVLGQGEAALSALSEGRKWMDVEGNQWYRPVLYLRWREEARRLIDDPAPTPAPEIVIRIEIEIKALRKNIARLESQAQTSTSPVEQAKLKAQEQSLLDQLQEKEIQLKEILEPRSAMSQRSEFYRRQIAQLEEQLAAVESDWETAATERDRLLLEKEAERLLEKIEQLSARLHGEK